MVGAVVIFSGLVVGGEAGSKYVQIALQSGQFDTCYDYSSAIAVKVICREKIQEQFYYFGISLGLISIGGLILVKGIRGKWDQNVKSDEMLGPKG
jgi:hypothetical protein